jgi:polysaccharide deacetylase family protein (PEP-CTERM system associated)
MWADPIAPRPPDAVRHAFTVDLEDWFQGLTSTNPRVDRWPTYDSRVVQATQPLLALLAEHDVRATFFVLGYVADQFPGLIEQIAAAGHEIGLHGYFHRFVSRLTPDQFRRELEQSLTAVRRITGAMPLGHRAPYFSINAGATWALDVLAEFGLAYDSSVFPTRNMLYGYPDGPRRPCAWSTGGGRTLWQFPATTVTLFGRAVPVAGGFYTRALPAAATRWAIDRVQAQGYPAVVYVHPWELDTGQRYRRVTPRERLTHYFGRKRLAAKLDGLLDRYAFAPLAALLPQPVVIP